MKTNFNEIAKLKEFNAREAALKQYIVSDVYNRPVIALYVSTYAKYNAGFLTGAWVNLQACEDKETFLKVCRALHGDEQYPELMFQDFCGFPRELYSECGGLDDLHKYIEILESVDDPEALAAFLEYFDFDELCEFEDRFKGAYDSEVDYAYECLRTIIFWTKWENLRLTLIMNPTHAIYSLMIMCLKVDTYSIRVD